MGGSHTRACWRVESATIRGWVLVTGGWPGIRRGNGGEKRKNLKEKLRVRWLYKRFSQLFGTLGSIVFMPLAEYLQKSKNSVLSCMRKAEDTKTAAKHETLEQHKRNSDHEKQDKMRRWIMSDRKHPQESLPAGIPFRQNSNGVVCASWY